MTATQFRRLALALPEAVEASHMDHPDFRVRKKIFATLTAAEDFGGVKLTPAQQQRWLEASRAFFPAAGAWGRAGFTMVTLRAAREADVERALYEAWCNTAPKTLVRQSAGG